MSELKSRITEDMKTAMRGGDKARLGVIRMLQAASNPISLVLKAPPTPEARHEAGKHAP